MPPQEGCAIYKRPPDKRSTVFFLCRKRHGYTRDFLDWPTNRNLLGFQCRKRQCYTRDLRSVCGNKRYRRSFNAASGNAIRATYTYQSEDEPNVEFQCRKRQCYTRDISEAKIVESVIAFQCRKRQCYTRDSVSRGPHNCWAHTEIFTTFPFFLEIGAFFEDTVFSKSPKTSCYPLISKGLSCPRFFVATSPVFRDKNEKIISSPSIASIRIRGKKFVACRRFCRSGVCVMVS